MRRGLARFLDGTLVNVVATGAFEDGLPVVLVDVRYSDSFPSDATPTGLGLFG